MTISVRTVYLLVILSVIIGLSGCSGNKISPTPTPVTGPVSVTTQPPAPEPQASPPSSPNPTPSPEPAALSPTEIFQTLSPSIAFIETPSRRGSGFLIDGNYLVTSAHVVWPYDTARVVFPDGTEIKDAPLVGWDYMADLAILGPVDVPIAPVSLADGETYPIGSPVYLLGYPNESETFPTPTMTEGILSRIREWDTAGLTYLQADATIQSGQSGGVLVNDKGEVLGITGLSWRGSFVLVTSSADIQPRIQEIIAGQAPDDLDRKPLHFGFEGPQVVTATLQSPWDQTMWVMWPDEGEQVSLEWEAPEEIDLNVVNDQNTPQDFEKLVTDWTGMHTKGQFIAEKHPYFLIPTQQGKLEDLFSLFLDEEEEDIEATWPMTVVVQASTPLLHFDDPDDHQEPLPWNHEKSQVWRGAEDFYGDVDVFPVSMEKDETIAIRAESVLILPEVIIVKSDKPEEVLASDIRSGHTLFGQTAELAFTAPEKGVYWIVIQNKNWFADAGFGGYLITVGPYQKGMPTPVALTPTPTPVATDVGPMQRYERDFPPLVTMLVPARWEYGSYDDCELFDWIDDSVFSSVFSNECYQDEETWQNLNILYDEEGVYDDVKSLTKLAGFAWDDLFDGEGKRLSRKKFENAHGYAFALSHYRSDDEHYWLAVTRADQMAVILLFSMDPTEKLEKPTQKAITQQVQAFQDLVMTTLDSFDVLEDSQNSPQH